MAKDLCKKLELAVAGGDFQIKTFWTMSTLAKVDATGLVRIDGKRLGFELISPPGEDRADNHPFDHDYFVFYVGRNSCEMETKPQQDSAPAPLDAGTIQRAREKLLASTEQFIQTYATRFQETRRGATFITTSQTPKPLEGLLDFFSVATVAGYLSRNEKYHPDFSLKPGESIGDHNRRVDEAWSDRTMLDRYFGDVGIEYVLDKEKKLAYFAIYHHKNEKIEGKPPVFLAVFKLKDGKLGESVLFVHNYNEDAGKFYIQ